MFEEIVDFIRSLYKGKDFIPLHEPCFRGNEKKYINECIDTTFVSSVGMFVDKFELEMAKYTGAKMAVACVNGSNALHLALLMVGVQKDTEVITQPLTFIATANAITYCGAKPIFLDVDRDTMGLSPDSLKKWLDDSIIQRVNKVTHTTETFNKLTHKRISACVPMHTFGHPCRIDEIVNICSHYGIPVVEDAAESLGSFYKNRHTGTFGKVGVLSFNGNKIISTGGGGMMLFNDVEMAKKAKHITTQAKVPHPWNFTHDETGYNYRMPNINAALGLAQLEQLPGFLKVKREIAEKYNNFFSTQNIGFFSEPINTKANYWLNTIFLNNSDERDAFLKFSNDNGVMTRPAWTLLNELPMFIESQTDELKNSRALADRLINLPSSVLYSNK